MLKTDLELLLAAYESMNIAFGKKTEDQVAFWTDVVECFCDIEMKDLLERVNSWTTGANPLYVKKRDVFGSELVSKICSSLFL